MGEKQRRVISDTSVMKLRAGIVNKFHQLYQCNLVVMNVWICRPDGQICNPTMSERFRTGGRNHCVDLIKSVFGFIDIFDILKSSLPCNHIGNLPQMGDERALESQIGAL
jgi:hypothetical protein